MASAAARTPLLLLPGLLCDDALWRHQVAALSAAADCRVPDFRTQDSVAAMAQAALDLAPPRFALAGLSMGGYVAFEVLRQAPERVTRLALIDTKARPDSPVETRRRRGLLELAEKGKFKGVTPRLLPLLIHEARLEDEALTAEIIDMAARIGRDGFLNQQRAILGRPDSRPTLAAVDCPTLILCGRQDALTPPGDHEEMAAAVPHATFQVIEDCGHLAPMERPDAVTAAMQPWLVEGGLGSGG